VLNDAAPGDAAVEFACNPTRTDRPVAGDLPADFREKYQACLKASASAATSTDASSSGDVTNVTQIKIDVSEKCRCEALGDACQPPAPRENPCKACLAENKPCVVSKAQDGSITARCGELADLCKNSPNPVLCAECAKRPDASLATVEVCVAQALRRRKIEAAINTHCKASASGSNAPLLVENSAECEVCVRASDGEAGEAALKLCVQAKLRNSGGFTTKSTATLATLPPRTLRPNVKRNVEQQEQLTAGAATRVVSACAALRAAAQADANSGDRKRQLTGRVTTRADLAANTRLNPDGTRSVEGEVETRLRDAAADIDAAVRTRLAAAAKDADARLNALQEARARICVNAQVDANTDLEIATADARLKATLCATTPNGDLSTERPDRADTDAVQAKLRAVATLARVKATAQLAEAASAKIKARLAARRARAQKCRTAAAAAADFKAKVAALRAAVDERVGDVDCKEARAALKAGVEACGSADAGVAGNRLSALACIDAKVKADIKVCHAAYKAKRAAARKALEANADLKLKGCRRVLKCVPPRPIRKCVWFHKIHDKKTSVDVTLKAVRDRINARLDANAEAQAKADANGGGKVKRQTASGEAEAETRFAALAERRECVEARLDALRENVQDKDDSDVSEKRHDAKVCLSIAKACNANRKDPEDDGSRKRATEPSDEQLENDMAALAAEEGDTQVEDSMEPAPEGTTTYAEEPVGDETEYDQVDMESTDSTPSSTGTTTGDNQTPGTDPNETTTVGESNETTTGGESNETTSNGGVNTEKSTSATPEDSTATDDSSVSRAALAIGAAAFTLFATLL